MVLQCGAFFALFANACMPSLVGTNLAFADGARANQVEINGEIKTANNVQAYPLNTQQPIAINTSGSAQVDSRQEYNYTCINSTFQVNQIVVGVSTGTSTYVMKLTPAWVAGIFVSSTCTAGTNFTLYDSTGGINTGVVVSTIAQISCGTIINYDMGLYTTNGLSAVVSGTGAAQNAIGSITVMWR